MTSAIQARLTLLLIGSLLLLEMIRVLLHLALALASDFIGFSTVLSFICSSEDSLNSDLQKFKK